MFNKSIAQQSVGHIQDAASKNIERKYKVYTSGSGVGMPGGVVRKISLCFSTKKPFSEEEIIRFIIDAAEEIVKQTNANEAIQPFLKEKPFTIKNVQIIIHNMSKQRTSMIAPEVTSGGITNGILDYYSVESEETFKIIKEFEISYEDAKKLLEQKKTNENLPKT